MTNYSEGRMNAGSIQLEGNQGDDGHLCPCCRGQDHSGESPDQIALRLKLLDLGGDRVDAGDHEFLLDLVEAGYATDGSGARLRKMEPSECHCNAASLWCDSMARMTIITGYALSVDGMWRKHSWARSGEEIIETTCRRELCFGFALDFGKALFFTLSNPPRFLRKPLRDSGGHFGCDEIFLPIFARLWGCSVKRASWIRRSQEMILAAVGERLMGELGGEQHPEDN
ncbi:hypothetical protein [Tautonia plasticadhaerens]|uniref:Uncharacterized protein n=1 Tax=Tautonia plasticadhaerens TaxID=2527974 RepID=A0A518HED6_9BACT|nr:hypothetical protein [Tautonia plasticadhaerens]QDV39213.1 hypothetical protein ElP_71770 [Tautonia plasticadhaerens]